MSNDDYTDDVFRKRGISPLVAEERGYRRYGASTRRGLEPIFEADERLRSGTYTKRRETKRFADWVEAKTGQMGWVMPGWVMPKHALPGSFFDAPLAQLRPDEPVPDRKHGHHHDGMEHVAVDCACGVQKHSEGMLDSWPVYGYEPALSEYERERHEYGQRHRYPDGEIIHVDANWHPLPQKRKKEGKPLPLDEPHSHVEMAKYLIAPGPHGKRWDTHPSLSGSDFRAAERVFVHMEGVLKCDALVSVHEVAIDTPSVTLWNRRADDLSAADLTTFLPRVVPDSGEEATAVPAKWQMYELERFLRAHVSAPVIIVCDSDWQHNPEVATQAFCLRDVIRDRDLECVVAAPPEGRYLHTDRHGRDILQKVGSDDFQGPDTGCPTGTPDDLVVVEPVGVPGFSRFGHEYERGARGASGRKRPAASIALDLEVLHWYATHSTAEGHVKRPATTIARWLGVSDDLVYDATQRLEEAGALVINDYYAPLVDTRLILEKRRRQKDRKRRTRDLGRGHAGKTATIVLREDLKPTLWRPTVAEWLQTL